LARITVVLWNEQEARDKSERLRGSGFEAQALFTPSGAGFRDLARDPPDIFVIDLGRAPSHGSAIALALRQRKSTRAVPLVFIKGDPEKTARVRALLPDAHFTDWNRIDPVLKKALAARPENPVVPGVFAGYSGAPLAKKLRIVENSAVALIGAPDGFESKLAPLPAGVAFERKPGKAPVILAFFKSKAALGRALPGLAEEMKQGRTLWLIWPKKTSHLAADLNQLNVREMGLAAGLVDYKICAIDETWSGLAFAARKGKASAISVRDER
jgi:CheY-like chemotaxis protein